MATPKESLFYVQSIQDARYDEGLLKTVGIR